MLQQTYCAKEERQVNAEMAMASTKADQNSDHKDDDGNNSRPSLIKPQADQRHQEQSPNGDHHSDDEVTRYMAIQCARLRERQNENKKLKHGQREEQSAEYDWRAHAV